MEFDSEKTGYLSKAEFGNLADLIIREYENLYHEDAVRFIISPRFFFFFLFFFVLRLIFRGNSIDVLHPYILSLIHF